MTTIKVFGEKAEQIENDEIFYAVVKSVEGRRVVELKSMHRMMAELRTAAERDE